MPHSEVTEKDFSTFLDISFYLTGFHQNELLATGMPETYYYTIMQEPDQDTVRAFFNDAQSILSDNKGNETQIIAEVGRRLIPSSQYDELAKRIIMLWYTGMWTSLKIVKEKTTGMVSPESYTQGLIWVAAETHPAGAKQPGFASWEEIPLSTKKKL